MQRSYRAFFIPMALLVATQLGIAQSDVVPFGPYDSYNAMPEFTRDALLYQATGRITCEMKFQKGKAISAKVISTNISIPVNPSERTVDVSGDMMRGTAATLLRWRSLELSDFAETVDVVYKLDSGLAQNERQFRLEYGKHWIPIRVEITGPITPTK